jgi:hypothetical protein
LFPGRNYLPNAIDGLREDIMTRPIEFRAWNSKIKEMEIVISIEWFFNEDTKKFDKPDVVTPKSQLKDQPILMQFTGLLDKNGKKVFEGDIVQWMSHRGRKEILIQAKIGWGTCGFWTQGWLDKLDMNYHNMEVIGNIYENPDYLSEGGRDET